MLHILVRGEVSDFTANKVREGKECTDNYKHSGKVLPSKFLRCFEDMKLFAMFLLLNHVDFPFMTEF